MTKKQLLEMLKNIPDDAIILVTDISDYDGWTWKPVTCCVYNPDNTVELYSGDTD